MILTPKFYLCTQGCAVELDRYKAGPQGIVRRESEGHGLSSPFALPTVVSVTFNIHQTFYSLLIRSADIYSST